MRRGRLVALLAFALTSSALAQGPSADWRTISTPHFRVSFPSEFEAFARHAGESLETAYPRVTASIGGSPPLPIEVVVRDPRGTANGAAIPWLDRPQIVLWASPPDADSDTGRFSDWIDVLSVHELAHVIHLARPGEGPLSLVARFSPAPLGPLVFRCPRWAYEGYATLLEGELTGSGRPGSAYQEMVLRQLAIEGKLPSYGKLSATRGWLSGSLAYLVGSAYLAWLDARGGADHLPELWKALEGWRSFDAAFRSVFGDAPEPLYEKFLGEVKARAHEQAGRLEKDGLVEGELWRRLEGGTASPSVSPDGTRLLARRDSSPRSSSLAVWEVADGSSIEAPPRWTLPRANGYSASDPRWMPGGREVLFARRAPDAEGVLIWDLYLWNPSARTVRRVTRGAGVADADPAPDGRHAVAVRNRFGISSLVTVDLETGAVIPLPASAGSEDDWLVWSHPRFSPDGREIAVLAHRDGRWRLVRLPAQGGAAIELPLPGEAVAEPAWSPDGTRTWIAADGSGIWNLYEVPVVGGEAQARTRVTGGAFSPAPAADGKAVYFLEFTAKGIDVRRLDLEKSQPVELAPFTPTVSQGISPLPPSGSPDHRRQAPGSRERRATRGDKGKGEGGPYSPWRSMTIRPLIGFSVTPSGNSAQLGVEGADIVGRLRWLAAGSVGDAAGPRGGALAAAWRASLLEVSGYLFSAIEKPGRQSLVARPELDEERAGGFLGLSWGRPFAWGGVRAEMGGGGTRVDAFDTGNRFWRSLGSAAGRVAVRRTREGYGFGADAEAQGSAGTTDERFWSQGYVGARVSGLTPFASISAGARAGGTTGEPTVFDLFSIGGVPSTILPPGLDRNRIASPALPAAVQLGERLESFRAELEGEEVPVVLYGEWLRAWSGPLRPPAIRVAGAEVRLERLVPPEADRRVTFRAGVAYVSSDAPRIRSTRGYAFLIYRP
jgi:hypothetical protein